MQEHPTTSAVMIHILSLGIQMTGLTGMLIYCYTFVNYKSHYYIMKEIQTTSKYHVFIYNTSLRFISQAMEPDVPEKYQVQETTVFVA